MEPITLEDLRKNTAGRTTWLVFENVLPLRGVERVLLSRLSRLLTPAKVRDVRLSLDVEAGELIAAWVTHDGGRGWLTFRTSNVPRLRGCGPARFQSFRVWGEKSA